MPLKVLTKMEVGGCVCGDDRQVVLPSLKCFRKADKVNSVQFKVLGA